MNRTFPKYTKWALLLLLICGGGLILTGCDSGTSQPDAKLIDGVALSGSENSDVAAVATHKDGEWLTAYSREDPSRVSEVVYGSGQGEQATVKLDDKGRPSIAVTGPYVLSFGNYNGNRADVALVDTRSGDIKTFDQIDLGVDFESLNLSTSAESSKPGKSKDITPEQATEAAGYGATTFVCAAAAIPAPDSPFTGAACAGSVLFQVATEAASRAGWGETAQWVGFGIDVADCAGSHGVDCVVSLIDVADIALDESETQISENEDDVAQASGVAQFGGKWSYRDINRGWFVMNEDLSYDAIYDEDESCYIIVRLDFLKVDGDRFTYERRSDGSQIRAEFTFESEDVLTATRLNDGEEFKWNRDPSQNTDEFFDNECTSSSSGSAANHLSR